MFEPIDVKKLIGLVEARVVRLYENKDGGVKPLNGNFVKKFKLGEWKAAFDEAEEIGSGGYVLFEP